MSRLTRPTILRGGFSNVEPPPKPTVENGEIIPVSTQGWPKGAVVTVTPGPGAGKTWDRP